MEIQPKEALSRAFCEVLEQLAYMSGELADKKDFREVLGDSLRGEMRFAGRISGALTLIAPASMCVEMAANALGTEPDGEAAVSNARDALKEVLNVACGNILTALAGEETTFDLSVPEVTAASGAEWMAMLGESDSLLFQVDERPVLLQLRLRGAEA